MNHENVFYIATTLALQFFGAPNDQHHQLQKISGAGAVPNRPWARLAGLRLLWWSGLSGRVGAVLQNVWQNSSIRLFKIHRKVKCL